jgi:ribonuclease HII
MLLSHYQANTTEAGCDEAGRGCLAGPVVAAAVILPQGYTHATLNDSKKMTHTQRNALRIDIERDALAFAVAFVSPQEIDAINILKASFLAMHRALDTLSLEPELLLIDGNRFTPYGTTPHTCIIKGDGKYLSIAAASILAKTYRDDYMLAQHELFPHYNWCSNQGYPTKQHRAAIREHGTTPLHRMTFRLLPEATLFD